MARAARKLAVVATGPLVISPYIRVSKVMGRHGEEFISPDLQLEACRRVIAAAKAIEGPTFTDIDESGRQWNRAGLNGALAAKASGEIHGVAVLRLNRIGRTAVEIMRTVREFDAGRGAFLSEKESIDSSTPGGKIVLAVLASLAENESDEKSENWRDAIRHRATELGHHNGMPPTGYKREKREDGKTRIVVDAGKAPAIADAFRRYDAGESASSITDDLRRRGVYRGQTVKRLLANPFFVGKVRLFVYDGVAENRELRNVEPIIADGAHEAIVDDELFERVQKRLAREARLPRRHVTPVHALAGLVRCGKCGRSATCWTPTGAARGQGYRYVCGERRKVECSGFGTPDVRETERATLAEVARLAAKFRVGDAAVLAAMRTRADVLAERERIEKLIERTRDAIADADVDARLGDLTPDRHERLVGKLTAKIDGYRADLADLPEIADDAATPIEFVNAAERIAAEWPSATPTERNALLLACRVTRVELRPASYWREPVAARVDVTFSL